MRTARFLTVFFIVTFMTASCATMSTHLPEKYAALDNDLEEVRQINNFHLDSWQRVDDQSFIIQSNINDYYLFVLNRPAPNLIYSETIGITHTASNIRAGFEAIYIDGSGGPSSSYIIMNIYKLNDRKQVKEIRERLANEA